MRKIRELLRLQEKSALSERQIARALNISRPVVAQYLTDFRLAGLCYENVEKMSDSELLRILEKGREKKSKKYKALSEKFEYFLKELKKTGVTLQILWEEYRLEHPDGYGYSQFCHHFQVWRCASKVHMHIEHKAGDKMFVDYAGKKFTIYDPVTEEPIEVNVFVAVLGASQLTYAEATMTQKQRDWITSNENALWYFGGVPAAIVPDCLKTGVINGNKYEPRLNTVYLDFAEHYGTAIVPARPKRPTDKALAEIAVEIMYTRLFAPLRNQKFYSLKELNKAFRELLEKHNNMFFQRTQISRRSLFDDIEKEALKPLPVRKYEYKDFQNPRVQFNYHVELKEDRHYYSVPYQLKGEKVQMFYTAGAVEIYHDNIRVAFHQRDYKKYGYTTLKQHMPPEHQFYAEWSADKFLSWGAKIGEDTHLLIKAVLKSRKHPEQAYKSCLGILSFAKKYGQERLEKACSRALEFEAYSYKSVKNILERGLDTIQEKAQRSQKVISFHENNRGAGYYSENKNNG